MGVNDNPDELVLQQHQHWMDLALLQARQAAAAGEVPVGAVVVKEGVLLASGANAPIALHDATAHAEILALRAAGAAQNNYRLPGTTLYVTLEPCAMCAGAMVHARVETLVYATSDPRTGAAGSVHDLVRERRFNHQLNVVSGIRQQEAAEMLRTFFRSRR